MYHSIIDHKLHFYWTGQPTLLSHWKHIFYQHQNSGIPCTHNMSLSWIIGDGYTETICTSIEQVNLPYSYIWQIYYINTGIVRFLTHIICDSYYIMGDRRMEYIYWLLVNFPDNLVTRCTSIEQGNIHYSHIAKIYYINTGIVTFLTHILCVSSWIMGDGRMEYIYWLLVNFPDNFLTTCTSIEQGNLPPSHIAKMYYSSTGIVILLTHI
jgi:hypothetical protein